jgi:hypothetical protein
MIAFSSFGAASTIRNSGRRRSRWIRSSRPPGLGALATHGLDDEQDLLADRAHSDDDERRDGSGFAGEPHPAPRCHRELGARSAPPSANGHSRDPSRSSPCAKPGSPCPCLPWRRTRSGARRTPAGIGAGEVSASDQRVGNERAALAGPQRWALPLRVFSRQDRSTGRAAHRYWAEPSQRCRLRLVPLTAVRRRTCCCSSWRDLRRRGNAGIAWSDMDATETYVSKAPNAS